MDKDFWKQFPPIPGFSCIKMKEDIQAKIYEEIKDMTPDERIAYFNRAGERFQRRQRQAATRPAPLMAREEPVSYGKSK